MVELITTTTDFNVLTNKSIQQCNLDGIRRAIIGHRKQKELVNLDSLVSFLCGISATLS